MNAKDGKGKAEEIAAPTKETFDGVVIKAKTISSRRPLRTFSTKNATTTTSIHRTTRSAIASEVKPLEEIKEDLVTNDDAMAVDEHPRVAEPSQRISTRKSGANTQEVVTQEVQRVQVARWTSLHLVVRAKAQDDAQEDRAPKKWRTSSDAPETDVDELAQHEAEVAAVLDADGVPEALREMSGMISMLRIPRIQWLASMLLISSST